jgi:ATP-dependent RNA helicase DeaD
MTFSRSHPSLARALADRGYDTPTPVQAAVLEEGLDGRDLLVSAQTGSGKTVAYGLAMAQALLGGEDRFGSPKAPTGLVVAPTRELALQVQRELSWLYGPATGRVTACVGGMDIRREKRALSQGAHVVVGTPGRLCDHLDRGHLDLSSLRAVVLDEADEMLDLGFREDLERILDTTPGERRTLLFSATLPKGIVSIAQKYQRDAKRIATSSEGEPHGDIAYRIHAMAPQDRDHAVVNVLRYYDVRGALVFCTTREAVKHLHANLLERGFAAVALSGELTQAERTRALQALRDGRARVCVATDVAARGLDLPDLGLVIHADLPSDRQTLLHRSGRTARAGRKGTCVLLVPHPAGRRAERLLASARIEGAWSAPPSPAQIRKRDRERLVHEVAAVLERVTDEDRAAASVLGHQSPEDLAAALICLQRERLPAPEEMTASDAAGKGHMKPGRSKDGGPGNTVWFRMNVGRQGKADPRWLVPFLCRRGHVTKKDIGSIRIAARETRFEIATSVAERFASAASRPDEAEGDIRIEPVPKGAGAPGRAGPGGPPRRGKFRGPARAGERGKPGSASKGRKDGGGARGGKRTGGKGRKGAGGKGAPGRSKG